MVILKGIIQAIIFILTVFKVLGWNCNIGIEDTHLGNIEGW